MQVKEVKPYNLQLYGIKYFYWIQKNFQMDLFDS